MFLAGAVIGIADDTNGTNGVALGGPALPMGIESRRTAAAHITHGENTESAPCINY